MSTVNASAVGPRFACASFLRMMNRNKAAGVITDVKLTKLGWLTYHLEFKIESK